MQVLSETERVRRREFVADAKAASAAGLLIDEYTAQRDRAITEWCEFLHSEMEKMHASDPVEVLPQAFVRLEQHCVAAARAAAKAAAQEVVKSMLGKALR